MVKYFCDICEQPAEPGKRIVIGFVEDLSYLHQQAQSQTPNRIQICGDCLKKMAERTGKILE